MSLRKRMAEFGFESNEDYDFALRALFAARNQHLRCLNVAGESGRRKTAFANALAHALDYKRILYHDFSTPEPPPAPIVVTEDDKSNPGPADVALTTFERVVVEACAYAEGEPTVLILDQLQLAEFREQIRLYHFIHGGEWSLGSASVRANPKHLLMILISELALYHSLAKVSYRIWTDASGGRFEFRPQEFQLDAEAQPLFDSLALLFAALGSVPTPTEFGHIVDDLLQHVRTEEQLRATLFGWMERVDRGTLYAPALLPALSAAVEALNQMLGLEEVVMGDEVSSRAVE
jgi:hypothetical protein